MAKIALMSEKWFKEQIARLTAERDAARAESERLREESKAVSDMIVEGLEEFADQLPRLKPRSIDYPEGL